MNTESQKRHRVHDPIRLRRADDFLTALRLREVERESHRALNGHAREVVDLHGRLVASSGVDLAADFRVLTLGVLADNHEVDVARFPIAQRAAHPPQQLDPAHVDVLLEVAPDRDHSG
jgi:hypothetical protein